MEDDRRSIISEASLAVQALEKSQITEVKSMNSPPAAVKEVLSATFLLLGHTGSELEWKEIKKMMSKLGEDAVQKRVANLDFEKVPAETKTKAMTILSKYSYAGIKQVSMATAEFYKWASAVAQE